jgi:hypothetical protein
MGLQKTRDGEMAWMRDGGEEGEGAGLDVELWAGRYGEEGAVCLGGAEELPQGDLEVHCCGGQVDGDDGKW